MTRKAYIHKMQNLLMAIEKHPTSKWPKGHKAGPGLRAVQDHAKEAVKTYGSYDAIWNHPILKQTRDFYGVG